MNRILNKYGALDHTTELGRRVADLINTLGGGIDLVCSGLTTEEIIAFEHQLFLEIGASCSGNLLRRAMQMRKAERGNKGNPANN